MSSEPPEGPAQSQGGLLASIWLWPVLAAAVLLIAFLAAYIVCRRRQPSLSSSGSVEVGDSGIGSLTFNGGSIDEVIDADYDNPLASEDFAQFDAPGASSSDGVADDGAVLDDGTFPEGSRANSPSQSEG
jgi:hypothetical protein